MKTPDEIKKGLEGGVSYHVHKGEAYLGYTALAETQHKMSDALAYIQQLEAANAELLTKVKQLEAKCHQLELERDALISEFELLDCPCDFCKDISKNALEEPCCGCKHVFKGEESRFEWRGVKEE